MELVGDQVGFQLKEQVHVSLEVHQCSILNMAQNPSICELSPWLKMFCWHELAVNHIILTSTPFDHNKQTNVFLTLISGEFNLDCLPFMVQAYLENTQTMIGHVPYHLKWLVVYVEDSHVATMKFNQLWVPSTINKYCMLMTKLFIIMVRSRDNNLVDDKPFVNVLDNLHLDLANALENFISYIQCRQDANMVLLHICRPPTCLVVQQELQTSCPIIRVPDCEQLKVGPFIKQLCI